MNQSAVPDVSPSTLEVVPLGGLGEFGMNLSKAARAVAIPSLEIDQPDCRRAAHSSSVGPIDETQLFYLESRGIPPDEARKFIVLGFLEPVVARVPLADVQDRLRELLEQKWAAGTVDSAAANPRASRVSASIERAPPRAPAEHPRASVNGSVSGASRVRDGVAGRSRDAAERRRDRRARGDGRSDGAPRLSPVHIQRWPQSARR